jgi:maltooligosyltrehalose trehalohydrolase
LLGRALAEGFAWQGEPSAYRHGAPRGTPSTELPPLAFVNATQTHDQVGNRAFGERIATLAAAHGREDALRALVACVLLAPSPPLLFMGEEYAASTPFLYFCDFAGELARAVTEGRRNEFGRFARFADPAVRERIPDPNAAASFERSKLDWAERTAPAHVAWLALYTQLLAIRQRSLMPLLGDARRGTWHLDGTRLAVRWPLGGGCRLHLLANLGDAACAAAPLPPGELLHGSAAVQEMLPAWAVRVSLERP